ncbi:MAG: phosphatidate cytidylyltransferase [Alicyclobacillus sp.]|nr:phosphatidate cytidylyltransferase [Alicyclobacillus sp.]
MLRQRVITAALALIVVLAVILWGPLPWKGLITLGSLLCMWEFAILAGVRWASPAALWHAAVMLVVLWRPAGWGLSALPWAAGAAFVWPVVLRNHVTLPQSSTLLAGALYIGAGGRALVDLRSLPHGLGWLLLLLVCIWLTDTAAFFGGAFFRGPKLWPSISPNKTLSGAVTGLAGGVIGACAVGAALLPGVSLGQCALIGAAASVAGQLGDLAESAYKRSAGVKDSGVLLPGHGGALDRVDSLLLAAPVAWAVISCVLDKGP